MEMQSDAVLRMATRQEVFSAHGRRVFVMDSVSYAEATDAGHVIVTGSHGGRSAGEYAARILPLVSVCSDAGIGKNQAGVAGLSDLDEFGVVGIGIDYRSARIGDGADLWQEGIVSYVNRCGQSAGISAGKPLKETLKAFLNANPSFCPRQISKGTSAVAPMQRSIVAEHDGRKVVAMDSISIIHPEDRDQIVVAGSNGGLASGELALRTRPAFVALNDAGIGKDNAGIAGLIQMDGAGIPGIGIGHESAEISSGLDMWSNGLVSFVNKAASVLGARERMTLREAAMLCRGR